ncbi:recombinase family protein [Micromonospora sp. WMMD1120]|uniref:recombinase family protein n=1 Tax=Micromonospora sp. WMMD1120 TaxID=3016106 RepID=UPI002415C1E8|nr:recombinase family protein [Micromonospora sp. WMMD1120]MDG4809394.1 recombinase family protein [Micromonospora sp. WMMD1120]
MSDVGVRVERASTRRRPPYGYRQVEKMFTGGTTATVLEPDAVAASVVRRIFEEYVGGRGLQLIAESLTADGILSPSAYDRARNPHFGGVAWPKGTVRAILVNSRYTGYEDHRQVYPPLIHEELFTRAQEAIASKRVVSVDDSASGRPYLFRGILRCGFCNRVMQGSRKGGESYYRCRFPERYADANGIAHPRNVYLREQRLLGPLRRWLAASCPLRHLPDGFGRASPHRADPADEVGLYQALHLRLTYLAPGSTVQARIAVAPTGAVLRTALAL